MPPPRFPQLYDLMDSVWLRMYREGHPDFLNKIAAEICRQENIFDPSIQRAIRMFVRNRHYRVLMPMLRGEKPKTCNGYPRATPVKNLASSQNDRGLGQSVFPGCFEPSHNSANKESSKIASANNSYTDDYMDCDNVEKRKIKEETLNVPSSPDCQHHGQEISSTVVHSPISPPSTSHLSEGSTPNISVIMHPTSYCHTTTPSQAATLSNGYNPVVSHSTKGPANTKTKLQNLNSPNQLSPPLNILRRHPKLPENDNNRIPNVFFPSNHASSAKAAVAPSNFLFPFFSGAPGLINPLAWPFLSNRTPTSEGQGNVSIENSNSDHSDEEIVDTTNGVIDFSRNGHSDKNNAKSKDSANLQNSNSNIKWKITADGNCLNIKPKFVCKCGVDQLSRSSQTDSTSQKEPCSGSSEDNLAVDSFERELSNWSVFQQCTNGSVHIADIQKYCDFLTTRYSINVDINEDWIEQFCMRHKVKVD